MQRNFDFLNLRHRRSHSAQRVLLSANVMHFSQSNEKTEIQLIITKLHVYLEYKKTVLRKIDISDIEAITISELSSEFVLHVADDEDERLASYDNKHSIMEMLLFLLTTASNAFIDSGAKVPVYFVDEVNLNLFVTTEEDLEDGHAIRPDNKHRVHMDHRDFLSRVEKSEESRQRQRKNTTTLYGRTDKKVSIEDFELLKMLGKGGHGKVMLCEKKTGAKGIYALKIIKKQHVIEHNQLEHTRAEKLILSHVNHPFLVSLQHAFQTDQKLYFVMEFMKGGELFQHLRRVKQFTEQQTKHIAACIVLALGHLHNKDYIYRDLKPENVLMDQNGFCKLTDFGLAKFLKAEELAQTFCGTAEYLAPEVILAKGCNRPADWWSLGVLIYEMIYGLPPFYSTNIQKMYKNIVVNELKFKKHTECSDEAKDFMSGLLVKKPRERLGSVADSLEIMSHPWFADIDWSRLLEKKVSMPFKPLKTDDDWEQNFDPVFTKERASDSIGSIDPKFVEKYNKHFEDFDFEPENVSAPGSSKRVLNIEDLSQSGGQMIEARFSDCDSLNTRPTQKMENMEEEEVRAHGSSVEKLVKRERNDSQNSSSSLPNE